MHAASALASPAITVTIAEPSGHHPFLTRLAAVAGGTQPRSDAAAALSDLLPTAGIERAAVVGVHEAEDTVRVELADGRSIDADAVIVASGAEAMRPAIRGFDHALTLRSPADAFEIGDQLESTDHLIVVGGGATGCQLAGAAAHHRPELRVTIIEATGRLLGGFPPALGHRTATILDQRSVAVRLDSRVAEITGDGVLLEATFGGAEPRSLAGTVVFAGGFEAQGSNFGETRDGRLVIDAAGRLAGCGRVFAAGDIAAHTDRRGALRPMSAQIAAQAGRGVGRNVRRFLAGADPEPFGLTDLGWVVDLGGGRGVAEVLGVPLADPFTDRLVPLLHTAIDYRNLWQIGGFTAMRRFGPGLATTPTLEALERELGSFGLDRSLGSEDD